MSATTDHPQLRWELKRVSLFAALSDADLAHIVSRGELLVLPARRVLFKEGDLGDAMYVVLSGKVKASVYSPDGREVILSFAGEGSVLGEIGVLDGGPRTATATAMETTRAFRVGRADLMPVLRRNPDAALHIISVLCERLRNTNRMVEDNVFLAGGPRLARTILRLLELHGHQDGASWRLPMKLPQSALGAHAGLMRESVNRQMRAWQEDGVLESTDDGLIVLRRDLLEEISRAESQP